MPISVALATFNGARFIQVQLQSILDQETPVSQIVISDDASSDSTLDEIGRITRNLNFDVTVLRSPFRQGVHANFRKAVAACTEDLIFLCDQDDYWMPHKTHVMSEVISGRTLAVAIHDSALCDASLSVIHQSSQRRYDQLGIGDHRSPGFCMAFTRDLVPLFGKMPLELPHDHCIKAIASKLGDLIRVPEVLTLYRRHGENASDWLPDSIKPIDLSNRLLFKARYSANQVLATLGVRRSERSNIGHIERRVVDALYRDR